MAAKLAAQRNVAGAAVADEIVDEWLLRRSSDERLGLECGIGGSMGENDHSRQRQQRQQQQQQQPQ